MSTIYSTQTQIYKNCTTLVQTCTQNDINIQGCTSVCTNILHHHNITKKQINKQSHDKIDTTVYTDGRIWIKRVTPMIPVILMIDGRDGRLEEGAGQKI